MCPIQCNFFDNYVISMLEFLIVDEIKLPYRYYYSQLLIELKDYKGVVYNRSWIYFSKCLRLTVYVVELNTN